MPTVKRHIFLLLIIALAIRITYVLFALSIQDFSDELSFGVNNQEIINLFKRHDSYWYEKIHNEGYPKISSALELGWNSGADFHQSSWGFMPGYPLIVKLVSIVTGLNFSYAATLVSLIFSFLAIALLYRFASIYWTDAKKAFYTVLLFMVLPFQYYLFVMYSEAVFISVLLGALLAIHGDKLWLSGLLLSLLVVMRASGVVLLLPVFLYVLECKSIKLVTLIPFRANCLRLFIPFIFPIVTMVGYILFQYYMTGDPFAYSTAQKAGWYREFTIPFFALFNHGSFTVQFNSIYAIFIMVIAFAYRKNFTPTLNLIIWISLLLPLAAGTPVAMTRYVSIIFPLFFIYANWVKKINYHIFFFVTAFILQLWTFYFWLISDSFSQ